MHILRKMGIIMRIQGLIGFFVKGGGGGGGGTSL